MRELPRTTCSDVIITTRPNLLLHLAWLSQLSLLMIPLSHHKSSYLNWALGTVNMLPSSSTQPPLLQAQQLQLRPPRQGSGSSAAA